MNHQLNLSVLKTCLIRYSRLILLILLFIFFSCVTKTFWSWNNWGNIQNIVLQQAPFTVLLATCMTLSIILNGFDLSIGSAVALISCVAGFVLHGTANSWIAIFTSIALGTLIGLVNSMLIRIGIQPFIATYAMQLILLSYAFQIIGGSMCRLCAPSWIHAVSAAPRSLPGRRV